MKHPRHVERGQGLMQYAACGVLSIPGITAIVLAGAVSLISGVPFLNLLVMAAVPLYIFAVSAVMLGELKVSFVMHCIMVGVMAGVGIVVMGVPRLTALLYEGAVFVVAWLPLLWNVVSGRLNKTR